MSYNDNNKRGLPDPNPKPEVPSEELKQDLTAVYHVVSEKDIQEYNNDKTTEKDEAYQYGFSKKPSRATKKSGGKKVRLRIILGAIAGLLGILLGVFFFGLWYKEYLLNQITYETTAPDEVITIVDELGSTVPLSDVTETTQFEVIQDEPIKNFLLIGIDSRSKSYSSDGKGDRSDITMVMSIDSKNGTIKLISIPRDTYAYFPGYSNPHKINAAMSYGGPELLQATVENCLRIKIDGYAYVNFSHMAQIIDAVGGVYVNMTAGEKDIANNYIKEMNSNAALISSTGSGTWLNGIQAVAYARIRYIGNGEYERQERQVEVLRSLLNQYMGLSATNKLACLDDILGAVVTNISKEDIEHYALDFLPSLQNAEIMYLQLAIEGCYNSGMYGDEWSIRANWNAYVPYVQLFFYGTTTEFDEVKVPSHAPSLDSCKTDIPLDQLVH